MLLLVFAAVPVAAVQQGNIAPCTGTQEPGARRSCIGKTSHANSAEECKTLCCADSAAHPLPVPGASPQGCVAW